MVYALLAAIGTAIAVRLLSEGPRDLASAGLRASRPTADDANVSTALVLSLLRVAVQQGSSIPGSLDAVGEAMEGACGSGLRRAAVSLRAGAGWHHAWLAARAEVEKTTAALREGGSGRSGTAIHADAERLFSMLEQSLEPAWRRGASPIMRLDAAIDRLDVDERSRIEEAAGRLSVRLLLPTGLCFLPAFVIVGVIPAIASFLL